MPSRRSSVRSRISSHRQQPIQPQVYDEEESNQVPDEELVPVQAKRSHRSSKKPVKSSSNHKRRRRQRSESSEEPDQLSDYGHSSNETSSSEEEDEEGDLGSEEYEETESVGEDDPRKRTFIPRDRDPVYIQNRSFPPLLLPPSSDDLLIPSELVLPAFGIYEILRRFAQSLQLTPFRLEDFCCAIVAEENSKLICEIFSAIVRLTVRESEHVGSWLAPHDEKDSVYLASMCLDSLTWPELIRGILQSSPEYSDGLRIVEQRSFPCVSAKDKLDLLGILCGAILRLPGVIRAALNTDISIQHEENCRNCQKPGDLICCEMCPATYHLECASPPLKEVPEGEWFCPICKFNQAVTGVGECVTEIEKQNYSLRHEPIGLDRHGRRFAFISRRLLVYEEDESAVRYYSTVEQFEEVSALLDPKDLEKELCEALADLRSEIVHHMEITAKLTKKLSGSRPIYLDKVDSNIVEERTRKTETADGIERIEEASEPPEVPQEDLKSADSSQNGPISAEAIKEEEMHDFGSGPRVATRTRTGAIVAKSYGDGVTPGRQKDGSLLPDATQTYELSKIAGPLYKLGLEGTFRIYRNIYVENAFAQNKVQKQEERDRKRHLAGKFSIGNDKGAAGGTDFRWLGLTLGISKVIMSTLRVTIADMEKAIHPCYFHPHWSQYREEWTRFVTKAERPEELAVALTRLESSCKPVIFAPAWHESLGCIRWGKFAAVDRDELRSRRRDDEEQTSRSAKRAYVNFVQGVQHQIWKHKGEEFRLSGKGGVFWWSARLADEDDCDVPQSLPQSDNNTDGDVIDVSACFRSTDSKFYPVEEALREQFGDSLKELDRLMALKPEPPSPVKPVPVAKPTPAADSTEEKRSIASQDRMQNGQATEEEKDKMADEVAKEPSEDKMDVDSVTSKENAESTDVTAASEVVEENKTEGAKVDVEAKEEIAEGEKEEEKKDEPVEAKGSSTAGVVNLNSPSTVRYKALLPKLLQMSDKLDLLDFYRISHTDFFVLAINAGLSELGGFKYDYKSTPHWEYPHFPRPNIRTVWRFRTYAIKNLGGVALQLKVLHAGLRWDDMSTRAPYGAKKTIQDELGLVCCEVIQKKATARYCDFPRSEYLVKRTVVPFNDGNSKYIHKTTPGREGLRERRVESPKAKQPFSHESWVGEEELELWEIKSYYERIEHPPEPPKPKPPATPNKMVTQHNLRVLPSTPLSGTSIQASQRFNNLNLAKSTNNLRDGQFVIQTGSGNDGKPQYVILPSRNTNGPIPVSTAQPNDGRGGALLIPVTSSSNQQLYQYRTFQSMSHNPITSPQARLNVAPMIIGADDESEPRNEIPVNSQQIRTLTEDELQIYLEQAMSSGSLSQESLNKLQKSYRELVTSPPGKTRPAKPKEGFLIEPALPGLKVTGPDAFMVASIERINKRALQLKKILEKRVMNQIRSGYEKAQMASHGSTLQKLVDENPEFAALLPKRPKSEPQTVREEASPRRKGRPPLYRKERPATVHSGLPDTKVSVITRPSTTLPEDPNAIPLLRINKKLLQVSGDEPKVTKAKMISTAPKIDESALIDKPIRKRGRKSNIQKQEEAAAAEAALLAQQVAAAAAALVAENELKALRAIKEAEEASRKKKKRSKEEKRLRREREQRKMEKKRKELEAALAVEDFKANKRKKTFGQEDFKEEITAEDLEQEELRADSRMDGVGNAGDGKKRKRPSDLEMPPPLVSPSRPKKKRKRLHDTQVEEKVGELHCYCRTPYDEDKFYIGCDRCEKWFHGDCVGVKENDSDAKQAEWFCPTCRKPNIEVSPPVKREPPKKKKSKQPEKSRVPFVTTKFRTPSPEKHLSKPLPVDSSFPMPKLKIKLGPMPPVVDNPEDLMPAPIPIPRVTDFRPLPEPASNLPKITLRLKKKPKVLLSKPPIPIPSQPVLEESVREPQPVAIPPPVPAPVAQNPPVQNGQQVVAREPGKQTKGVSYCFCREVFDGSKGYRKFIKCDRCREWYHPRCVGLTTSRADSLRNFVCPACQNSTVIKDFLYRQLKPEDFRTLASIVEDLKKHRGAWPFVQAVNPAEAPDYYLVISEPMDLSTIARKVHEHVYKTVQEFMYDCGLVFDNARTFNREETIYYRFADQLEEVFVNRINKFRLQWKP